MWYLCMRSNVRPREQRTTSPDEHFAWMRTQHESGAILMSGPTSDRKYGMYLIRASSRDEADSIAASDPYTVAGDTTYELLEWEIHQIMGVGEFAQVPVTH
jgi:uncharacterized protein YciI